MKQLLTRILIFQLIFVMSGYFQVSVQTLSSAWCEDFNWSVQEDAPQSTFDLDTNSATQFHLAPNVFYSGLIAGILDGFEEEDELESLKKKKGQYFIFLFENQQNASAFHLPGGQAIEKSLLAVSSPTYLELEVFRI